MRLALAVLDGLPLAVIVAEPDGTALLVNTRAAKILQHSADELVAMNMTELFRALSPGEPGQTLTRRVKRASGEVVTLEYAKNTVEAEPGHPVTAITFRDVSDTERLRGERDRLLQLAAVGETLPTLLHEVRNPLSAVIATVELLLEDSAPGATQDSLHAVLSEARRIALQLDGVGAVGRSLRSRRASAVDLACRETCSVVVPRAEKAKVLLRWDVPDMPLLPLDPSTLRALLFNLLTNAIDACRPGDTVRVHALLTQGGRALEISVIDTGVGMTAEVYARCTELFFTTKRHGSGIGLALCRRAVETAGGTLEIQSVPGFGTAIVLTVPLVKPTGRESDVPPAM